jgi:hypothetical protein
MSGNAAQPGVAADELLAERQYRWIASNSSLNATYGKILA